MFTKAELIGALCTALAFLSAAQILLTGILSFAFPHFLSLSHCSMATAAGVISGLVAVPMIIQLKTAQISPLIELRYGYTKWYQVIAIIVCASLHVVADIIALISVLVPRQWNDEFLNKMREYKVKKSSKSVVDNIQWALQCCGSVSYKDWYTVKWTKISARSTLVDIIRDTAGYFETTKEVNSVPFSCCARKILETCMHYDVSQYGTNTISVSGCSLKMQHTAQLILWSEFGVYAICVLIEVSIFIVQETANGTIMVAKYISKPTTGYTGCDF
ncbi:tetraspanin family [Holotrichia oblita]|uniref:Tetraspanin family n=1 Tax=Holotrichia oblita TaxID=644536 RepID=A0ACB9TVW2_HOLOL|nr:tetraspanin family [Holotrichia oblita]